MPPNKHNYTTRAHRFRFRVSPNVLQQNSKLIATKAHLVLRNTTRPTRKGKRRSWFARWCECVRCCAAWAASKRPTKPTKVYFWKGRDRFFLFVVTIFCLQNIPLLLLLSVLRPICVRVRAVTTNHCVGDFHQPRAFEAKGTTTTASDSKHNNTQP